MDSLIGHCQIRNVLRKVDEEKVVTSLNRPGAGNMVIGHIQNHLKHKCKRRRKINLAMSLNLTIIFEDWSLKRKMPECVDDLIYGIPNKVSGGPGVGKVILKVALTYPDGIKVFFFDYCIVLQKT